MSSRRITVLVVVALIAVGAFVWRLSAPRADTLMADAPARDEIAMLSGGPYRCAPVRPGAWSPLPGLEYSGRLGITLPAAVGGAIVLVVGDALPLDVKVEAADGLPVRMRREAVAPANAPPDYWLEAGTPRDAPPEVQEITFLANHERSRLLSVRLGRRAPRVLARLRGFRDDVHATVCAAPISRDVAFRATESAVVILPDQDAHFGTGWSDVMPRSGAGPVRWMARHAALLIPFARRGQMRVTLHADRPRETGDGEVSLRINDLFDASALPLRAGAQRYEWTLPASAWLIGTNEVLLHVTGEGADHLLAFMRLELSLVQ